MYSSAFCHIYNQLGWNYFPEAFGQQLLTWLSDSGVTVKDSLDLACGTGVLCEILHAHGIRACGSDLSEGMIAIARERAPHIPYRVADMVLDRPEGSYDLVTCTGDAINHIMTLEDVAKIFANVRRCLRPGGHFIFDVLSGQEIPDAEPFDLDFSETVKARFQVLSDAAGRVHLQTTVWEDGKPPFTEEIVETVHDITAVCALLEAGGFRVLRCADRLLAHSEARGSSWYIIAQAL